MSISDGPMAAETSLYDSIKGSAKIAFLATAVGLNNPVGHDAFYQTALRAWFSPAWMSTMSMRTFHLQLLGRDINLQVPLPISFQEFRDNAPFYVHHEDMDVFGHRLRLLQDPFSFCLPFVSDAEDGQNPQKPIEACHAAISREEGKGGKKRPQNHCN